MTRSRRKVRMGLVTSNKMTKTIVVRVTRLVRHPQYTGIFLGLFGQLIHWPTIPTVVLFPIVVWAYVRLARREERQMIERFGDAYEAYRRRVPRFFPRRGQWRRLLEASRPPAEADRA